MKPKSKKLFDAWRLVPDGSQLCLYRVNPVSGNARRTYCPFIQSQDGEVTCGSCCPHFCLFPRCSKTVTVVELTCGTITSRPIELFRIKKDTKI